MKNRLLQLLILALTIATPQNTSAQSEKFMTLNVRCDVKSDGINVWDNRKESVVNLIEHYSPDVLGIQEAYKHQKEYMEDNLTEYKAIGVGRDDGKEEGEFMAILYNASKYKLMKEVTFWLSETPDEVSFGWDAACKRTCTYGLFKNKKTQKETHVFNTHFDHKGETAREESAKLIVKKIDELVKDNSTVIIMCDLNSTPDTEQIQLLETKVTDGAKSSPNGIYVPIGTFTGFNKDAVLDKRIDYIFVKNSKVAKYSHIDDRREDNLWISDHLPVLLELE
jgi:endonuclease/exonuclease/phosphatase family metal-dependent hydrolase